MRATMLALDDDLAAQGENSIRRNGTCGSSKLDPSEFIGGFERLAIACGARGCRPASHSWWPEAAHREPALRCCSNRSRCVIKSVWWFLKTSSARTETRDTRRGALTRWTSNQESDAATVT